MTQESANLDVLRATAVMLVLVFHLLLFQGVISIAGVSIRPMGLLGVLLFFVHTTLVLMLSLRRQQQQYPGMPIFSGFMLRRIFRIYPLSIVVVGAILLFRIPQTNLEPHSLSWTVISPGGWLANFLLMQNLIRTPSVLGVLWSLPFEIQMYCLLPALYLMATRSRRAFPVIGIWLAALLLNLGLMRLPVSYFFELAQYMPNFIPGVIAYKLSSSAQRKLPFWLWPIFLAVLVVGFIVQAATHASIAVYLGWGCCLALGLGIPFFAELPAGVAKTVAHLIAKYSYGIYLCHYFAIWVGFGVLQAWPLALRWSVFTVLIVSVPVVLFHTIEAPLIRVGGRVVKQVVPRLARRPALLAPELAVVTPKAQPLAEAAAGRE